MAHFSFRKSVTNDIFSEYHENRKEIYLDKVVESRHNGMIKIITGVRRSGKCKHIPKWKESTALW